MFVTTSDVAVAVARLRDARRRLEDATAALRRARDPGWDSPAGDACRDAVTGLLGTLDRDAAVLDEAVRTTDGCLPP